MEKTPCAFISERQEQGTLGLLWNSTLDTLQYDVQTELETKRTTKRVILAIISKILGLIGPTTIKAKILLQQLWKLNLTWDESVPIQIHTTWTKFHQTLHNLNKIKIPRHVMCMQPRDIQLHGFSDASTLAYGACLYVRSMDAEGNVPVYLATAKSRVAPLKCVSLPRLELCAAVLLSQLAEKYKKSVKLNFTRTIYWCDSTITLAWIVGSPSKWKTFVSNRVSEIQNKTTDGEWRHIPSSDNPADIISRGATADQLVNNSLWWNGPQWLHSDHWPQSHYPADTGEEAKPTTSLIIANQNELDVLTKFSKFSKLQRVIAYCMRFCNNFFKLDKKRTGILSSRELENATLRIVSIIQNQCFPTELKSLQIGQAIDKKSALLTLNPYLDEHGLLRVGGRIQRANISLDHKHPLILPKGHYVTYLIMKQEHIRLRHCGHGQLLAAVRLKFWLLSGRQMVKKITRTCIQCFKFKPRQIQPMMGDLPKGRVIASCRPFVTTGVDYAGPIQIRETRRRGKPIITKGYMCIFVCFNTKAIYIELVTNLLLLGSASTIHINR